jgi:hypothetical protein
MFNCKTFIGNKLNVSNNISFPNSQIINIDEIKFSNIDILNQMLKNLNPNIKILNICNIEIARTDTFRNKIDFDPSKYLNLERIQFSFNKCRMFNTYSFDLRNHTKLIKINLDNLIVYDLIGDNKFNIGNNIKYINLINTDKIRSKHLYNIDLTELNKLNILNIHNTKLDGLINLPESLKHIYLSNTNIKRIGNYPTKIQTITINNARLSEIPDLHHLTRLKQLSLISCEIKKVGTFGPKIQKINLSNNYLRQMPLFDLDVKYINLSNNRIKSIDNVNYDDYKNLITFDISNNKLKNININSTSIKNLNVSNNLIDNIQMLPSNIKDLNLARNNLSRELTIPNTVNYLNINYNNITKLNSNSITIHKLYAKNNRLEKLRIISYYEVLDTCELSKNMLKELYIDSARIENLNINNNTDLVVYLKNMLNIRIDNMNYSNKYPIKNHITYCKYINKSSYILYNYYSDFEVLN